MMPETSHRGLNANSRAATTCLENLGLKAHQGGPGLSPGHGARTARTQGTARGDVLMRFPTDKGTWQPSPRTMMARPILPHYSSLGFGTKPQPRVHYAARVCSAPASALSSVQSCPPQSRRVSRHRGLLCLSQAKQEPQDTAEAGPQDTQRRAKPAGGRCLVPRTGDERRRPHSRAHTHHRHHQEPRGVKVHQLSNWVKRMKSLKSTL